MVKEMAIERKIIRAMLIIIRYRNFKALKVCRKALILQYLNKCIKINMALEARPKSFRIDEMVLIKNVLQNR